MVRLGEWKEKWRSSLRNVLLFHLPASVLTPCLIGMDLGGAKPKSAGLWLGWWRRSSSSSCTLDVRREAGGLDGACVRTPGPQRAAGSGEPEISCPPICLAVRVLRCDGGRGAGRWAWLGLVGTGQLLLGPRVGGRSSARFGVWVCVCRRGSQSAIYKRDMSLSCFASAMWCGSLSLPNSGVCWETPLGHRWASRQKCACPYCGPSLLPSLTRSLARGGELSLTRPQPRFC